MPVLEMVDFQRQFYLLLTVTAWFRLKTQMQQAINEWLLMCYKTIGFEVASVPSPTSEADPSIAI
jgi:hypothetical protein